MECPSCRFQNMPGLDRCGRCGALLAAADGETFMPDVPGVGERLVSRQRRAVRRILGWAGRIWAGARKLRD